MTISKDDVLQDCSVCGGTGNEPKAPEPSGGGHSFGHGHIHHSVLVNQGARHVKGRGSS